MTQKTMLPSNMMKCAIYGAGSLGTVPGAYMTKAGIKVDLISRNEAHVSALKASGAHISGTVDMTVPVNAMLSSEMTEVYDVIMDITSRSFGK